LYRTIIMPESRQEHHDGSARVFATTHWSVVIAAGQQDSAPARSALEILCRTYWYPIYVYVRRKGHGADDAQDLTQEFFAKLIGGQLLRQADQARGRFRSFLLGTLDHFLARQHTKAHRLKRGRQFTFISLDEQTPEERYRLEPADNDTPEKRFARQWAMTVLAQTMTNLEGECAKAQKSLLFHAARPLLSGERDAGGYRAIAEQISMSEGALRVAVHRLRQRYAELLREEIAHTVNGPNEVEEELRYLLGALSS
jgi:RNA polymerase sigma-70 factor (ECF subfamily)